MIITALFFVLLPSAFLSFVLRRRIEYFIGGILPFWGILLYLGGICRVLDFTYCAIVAAIWLMLPVGGGIVCFGIKRGKISEYCRLAIDQIVTPGCVLFVIGIFFANFVCEGRCFSLWDEFSHWGRIVYAIFFNNVLPVTDSRVLEIISFKSYPVGTSIIEYMFARHFDASQLSESAAMFAMATTEIAVLLLMTVKATWKNAWAAFLFVLSGLLVCGSFFPNFLRTVYVDTLLGLIMGGAYFLIIDDERFSWFNSILLTILLGFLILTKDSGSGLAIFVVIIPVFIGIYRIIGNISHKCYSDLSGNLRYFIPVAAFLLRFIHKVSLADIPKNFSSKKISVEGLIDGFTYWGHDRLHSIWTNMYKSVCYTKVSAFDVPVSYFTLTVVICMALFFSASLFRDQRKRIVQISALVLFVGFFVYSFTLFVYYVFVFPPAEAARLASLNRYMATYMIFEWMFLFAVGMCLTEVGDTKTPGIVCCMVLVPILNIPGWRDLFQSCEPIRNLSMTRFDVMDQVVAPYLVENKKFSIISNSALFDHYTAVTRWQSHYYDSQWRISANGVENQSGRRYSDASIMNLLKNTDYCYIAALNDAFIQTYGKYFEGDIEFAALYKCDGTKFRKLPLKQFIFDFQKTSLLRSQQRNALVSPSLKSHRLNVKVNSGGEVKIFPLPKLVPLHMGKVSKVVVFFADIRGDGKWEFRDKSNKLYGSGSMCEIEDQLVVTVDNVADFNFTFTVRTAKDQQCVFSISRLEVYYDNSNSNAPASAHELCDQHICTI